jgi:hypothetical protein
LRRLPARGSRPRAIWILWREDFLKNDGSTLYIERNFQKPGDWDSWGAWEVAGEFGFDILKVPHWFLILLFLLPWTTFLVWRARRMMRLADSPGSAGLQPGSQGP